MELDPDTNRLMDLGEIFPNTKGRIDVLDKIHNSLVLDDDGKLYIDQGLNISMYKIMLK